MKRSFLLLCFLLNVCFLLAQINGQYPFNDSSLSTDERIKDLLGRLTLEEKVAQMMNQTPAIERLGIPPYDWWNEALHGVARSGLATVFPQAIALAATFDDQAVYETFTMVSDEDCEKHKQKALEMARKSMVLLKNSNHTLPLSKSIRKIAVIGPNANDSVMLWANYNGFPSKTITILQGIQNKLPNTQVIYEKGCELVGDSVSKAGFDETVQNVKDADVLIFAGGISPSLEGEEMSVKVDGFRQGDRTNLELPATQQRLLRELK